MKILISISFFLTLIACSSEIDRVEAPQKLIPENKMILVMKEMIKLESHLQQKYKNVTKYHKVMLNSGDSLLQTFGFTRKQYDESMSYYSSRQDLMISMNEKVNDALTKEKAELLKKMKNQ